VWYLSSPEEHGADCLRDPNFVVATFCKGVWAALFVVDWFNTAAVSLVSLLQDAKPSLLVDLTCGLLGLLSGICFSHRSWFCRRASLLN
jgi:hypothetical protein